MLTMLATPLLSFANTRRRRLGAAARL